MNRGSPDENYVLPAHIIHWKECHQVIVANRATKETIKMRMELIRVKLAARENARIKLHRQVASHARLESFRIKFNKLAVTYVQLELFRIKPDKLAVNPVQLMKLLQTKDHPSVMNARLGKGQIIIIQLVWIARVIWSDQQVQTHANHALWDMRQIPIFQNVSYRIFQGMQHIPFSVL